MDSEGALELPEDSLSLNDPAVAFASVPKSTIEAFPLCQGVSLKVQELFSRVHFHIFFLNFNEYILYIIF